MNKNLLLSALLYLFLGLFSNSSLAVIDWVGNMFPTSGSSNSIDEGQNFTIYVQVYKAGTTEPAGQGAGITCQVYYGQVPAFGMPWTMAFTQPMTYNLDIGNNDEYVGSISPPAGLYEFTCRCSDDGGATWTFAQLPSGNGRLTVNSIPMPVELSSFEATAGTDAVDLSWSTASETNNSHFVVERSRDSKRWRLVGEVKGAGYSFEEQHYNFRDLQPGQGDLYYRLKQVDYDGGYEYSDIRAVYMKTLSRALIYPNPGPGNLQIELTTEAEGRLLLQLFDARGRLLHNSFESVAPGDQTYLRSFENLPRGVYWLRGILDDGKSLLQEKILLR